MYSDRVDLVFETTMDGYLGPEKTQHQVPNIPCKEGKLSINQQTGIFGNANFSAFTLHLQGRGYKDWSFQDVKQVIYKGKQRQVQGIIPRAMSTVVIVA